MGEQAWHQSPFTLTRQDWFGEEYLTYGEFQDRWEQEAERELSEFGRLSSAELAQRLSDGQYGVHFTFWRVLADKCKLVDVFEPMLRLLRSNADYLIRYHCADALIRLASVQGFEPIHLSANGPWNMDARLSEMEALIRAQLR